MIGSREISRGRDGFGSNPTQFPPKPFDPQAKLIFFSCSDGTLSIFHAKSANVYEDAGAVKTQPSARTMAFDPMTRKIFLPAAEYAETPPAQPGGRPGRTMKPGSFVVLVVGK